MLPTRRDLLLSAVGLALSPAALAMGETHDVAYAFGSLDALKRHHAVVARVLGPGVARKLVIVEHPDAGYALVYQRGGDLAGSNMVAARHKNLLAKHGLTARAHPRGGRVVFPTADPAPAVVAAHADPPTGVVVTVDSPLEEAMERHVKRLRAAGRLASDERTSWIVHDLTADRTLASINGAVPRQAASMIKPLLMLAFFQEAKRGRFIYGPVSKGRMEAMIQRSSNVATNWVIDQLGGPASAQRVLSRHYGKLLPQTSIVERIAAGGRTYRNMASVADYARYLRALWRDELPFSKEQRRILGLSNADRIYQGAPNIPKGTIVLDKTGSTSQCCGNMGILIARRKGGGTFPYIFCGVIEKASRASRYGPWISSRANVIRSVSDLTYRELKARYALA